MPSKEINPVVVQVMREKGIDISINKSKLVNNQMVQEAGMIIVMGWALRDFVQHRCLIKLWIGDLKIRKISL